MRAYVFPAVFLWLPLCLLGNGFQGTVLPLAAEPPQRVTLTSVMSIWDQAPHNAFTDLIRYQNRWWCTFREGKGHSGDAGIIRVITSGDGATWESAAIMEEKDVDLRDPKLSITSEGRLMLVGGAAVPATRNPLTDHYSFVCFSKDGRAWSKRERVLGSWQWLWRVTWNPKTRWAYGVAYSFDPRESPKKYSAFLSRSPDGVRWEKVTDFALANATEGTLAFDGDTMLCLQRRDGQPNTAQLGRSEPPYAQWTWHDLGQYLGGPNFLRATDGTWWAAGRLMQSGKAQTALCRLDVKAGKLEPVLALPSGGDTSYPGLVLHDGMLWMSYYSSHEKKTSIYLARVRLPSE
jgi:hypothetical protein